MRRLLFDGLFVCLRDGDYLTRPQGGFGSWRRVTGEQKNRLTELYLYAAEGVVLLTGFEIYRAFLGDSIGYQDSFNAAGFIFGVTILATQTWLLGDAPEISAPGFKRANTKTFRTARFFPWLLNFAQRFIVAISLFAASGALAAGWVLR